MPAQTGPALDYIWPVHGTVVDPFRPPTHRYGPGNRGLEFATQPGSAFWAAADGIVSFAGQVGGRLHVTVSHPDGLRVSYSGVASTSVRRGERVQQRQQLGTTGDRLHVGVRRGETYLDPAQIFGSSRSTSGQSSLGRPHLVPSSPSVYRLQLRWLHSGVGNAVL
ncbi:murein hydrolase activator EnvC family protein [Candidatus Poriferisodalis sp.]|uniref:murein hydrolase activator EnvC family protein n=1 Tax=Candidatus Poriferisodalis sp. TaxID=3101277 RepID=UPI003B013D43